MSVRFKFRSSVAFDLADLGGRFSISVRDLRAKIIAQKNLQICRDFDLVISDADTGQAFDDEDLEIPDGSSVILKRVPAGRSLPPDLEAAGPVGTSVGKQAGFITMIASSPSENVEMENFDDFGNDLYPTLMASLPESDADVGNEKATTNTMDNIVQRCSETSVSRYQNFERSDLSEAMPKGIREKCKKEVDKEKKKQTKLQSKEEHNKLNEAVGMSSLAMFNPGLPAELKCPLCNTIFKEAVMIRCCQHSFCNKCIRSALLERARCPKCSSLKFTVEDLLPNLSLRQAIEHFLEAQMAIKDADNLIPKNAPDEESGIQAKEVSRAVYIRQQDQAFPHSPSTTGKGSNQVMTESAYENKRTSAEALKQIADFQSGDGSLKLCQNRLHKGEDNFTIQKKVPGVNPSDGCGVLAPPLKHRKGGRTCYMCGSPNHLFRDCPASSNPYPVFQTGKGEATFHGGISAYGHPYWHGAPISHGRPSANIYGTPGVMPFDPTIVPVTPYGVPSYVPSLYAGMPVPYGFMRMPPSMMTGSERPLTHAEFMELQYGERNHKLLNEHLDRELEYGNISEDYHYDGTRSHGRKHHVDKEISRSCSDNDDQRLHKKHPHDRYSPSHRRSGFTSDEDIHLVVGKHAKRTDLSVSERNQRTYYSEKSESELHDMSDSSDRRGREKKRHCHESCSKKHIERRGHCNNDCSRKCHRQNQKEKYDDTKKVMKDYKKQSHEYRYHSEPGFELDFSSDRRPPQKEKESSQSSRHSRQKMKSTEDKLEDDRWEMVDGLEDYRKKFHYHKRKRTH